MVKSRAIRVSLKFPRFSYKGYLPKREKRFHLQKRSSGLPSSLDIRLMSLRHQNPRRALIALEGLGGSDAEQEALCSSALSAGLESAEDYMEVSLTRLDGLRRKGPSQMEALRKAFQDTNQLMEVRADGT